MERGLYHTQYGKQLVSFEGMEYEGRSGFTSVTPTDIDGYLQFDNGNIFILYELKYKNRRKDNSGQERALKSLADTVSRGGGCCLVIFAEHETPYPEPIIAKDAKVTEAYTCGHKREFKEGETLYELTNRYINIIRKGTA